MKERVQSGMRMRQNHTGVAKGFSLIEVLVTMTILVIGILAVARIFPYGFLSIQQTEDINLARAAASTQLADIPVAYNSITAGLPDSQGNLVEINNINPDNLVAGTVNELNALETAYNFALPANYPLYSFSDVNQLRYVHGEQFTVPSANPALHTLSLGPVYNVFHSDTSGNPADSLSVHSLPLLTMPETATPTPGNPEPLPNVPNAQSYAIDYANSEIAFYPEAPLTGSPTLTRTFLITYQGYPSNSITPVTYTISIVVPDVAQGSAAFWQPIFGSSTTVLSPAGVAVNQLPSLIAGSEQVTIQYHLVGTGPTISPVFQSGYPYQYAVYSPQETGNANIGTIVFNPLAHGQTVSVDYLTYDNHIIRDDRTMPDIAPYNIQLSFPNVLIQGDIRADQTLYDGLYHDIPGDTTRDEADAVIINRQTGLPIFYVAGTTIYLYNLANPYNNGQDAVVGVLDPKRGILEFAASGVEAVNALGHNEQTLPLRILYRAAKGWGEQIQQAAQTYTPLGAVGVNGLPPTDCYIGGGLSGGVSTRIYFSPSEEGKTITLSNVYYTTAQTVSTNPSTYGLATSLTLQIGNLTDSVNGAQLVYADITDAIPSATSLTSVVNGLAVGSVQGESLKSRVVWHNNTLQNGNYTWHKVDADGMLPTVGNSATQAPIVSGVNN